MRTEEKDKTIIDEKNDNVSEGTLKDDDYDGIGFDVDAPPEICELCKEDKLRERLEHLKNQNHALRKILQECTCTNDEIDKHQQESSSTRSVGIYKTETDILAWKENTSELISAVKLLQSKCRTKDGMIAALANELKETASEEETLKILKNLADPEIRKRAVDFDRVTLWKYLEAGRQIRPSVSGQSEQIHRKDLSIGILVLILVSLSALVQFDAYVARFIRNCFYFALVHAHQTFQILLYLLPSYTTILENIYWFTLISYRIIYPLLITTISFIKLHPILAFYGFILLNFILLSLADRYGHSICQRVSSSRRMLLKTIDSIDKSLVFAALGLLLEFSFSFFVFEFARERFFLVFLPPQAPVLFYFMRRAFSNYKLPEMLTLGELPKSPLIYCVAYVSCFALGYVFYTRFNYN
ncbi:uncharacterized protein [Prorops nasuta]|uniref:uncharacterized protein n=1 Tax=Prorops nasuta TaxID=863751 RepID=UPI0034CFC0D4